MIVPNPLGTKFVYFLASIVFGGVAAASGNVTGVSGGALQLWDFKANGTISNTVKVPVKEMFLAFVKGTGSTTIRYPAACFRNPLRGLSRGTGSIARLTYHAGNNPAGVGGDIGFVKNCAAAGGSGTDLIDNTCTSTGCVSFYTTGTALWNDADYIKFTPRANLTSSYTGRITGWVEDVWGE